MLDSFIEDRYSKRSRPIFHSSGFAIAAGVVGVGAAAASAGISMSASDRAAKAQSAAGRKLQKQTAEATSAYERRLKRATRKFTRQQNKLRREVEAIDPTINIPAYDLQGATAEGIEAANKVTANTLQQLERVAPGSTEARQQVGSIIGSYLRGEIPRDVQEQTMRSIAEFAGAGFNPATAGKVGGFQAAQGFVPRQALLTSLDLQQTGINAAQSWQQMAGQFIQSPTQMMALGLQGRAQDINVAQANIANQFRRAGALSGITSDIYGAQTGMAQTLYGAQTGQAQQGYQVGQENIAANLAAQQAIAQGVGDIGEAASGALAGVSYSKIAQMRAGGGGGIGPGGFNYEQAYGPATYGTAAPGFGNFDYGV
jgi:hypothetical protein